MKKPFSPLTSLSKAATALMFSAVVLSACSTARHQTASNAVSAPQQTPAAQQPAVAQRAGSQQTAIAAQQEESATELTAVAQADQKVTQEDIAATAATLSASLNKTTADVKSNAVRKKIAKLNNILAGIQSGKITANSRKADERLIHSAVVRKAEKAKGVSEVGATKEINNKLKWSLIALGGAIVLTILGAAVAGTGGGLLLVLATLAWIAAVVLFVLWIIEVA